MNKSKAELFADKCYKVLAAAFHLDQQHIGKPNYDFMTMEQRMRGLKTYLKSQMRLYSDIALKDTEKREMVAHESENIFTGAGSYEALGDTISLTLQPEIVDAQLISKLKQRYPYVENSLEVVYQQRHGIPYSDDRLMQSIAAELGHAIRARATEYAKSSQNKDKVIVLHKSDRYVLFLGEHFAASDRDALVDKIARKVDEEFQITFPSFSEFFEPISIGEAAEHLRGTPWSFEADLERYKEIPQKWLTETSLKEKEENTSEMLDFLNLAFHSPATLGFNAYVSDKEAFRKEYLEKERIIYWSPAQLFREFMLPKGAELEIISV